MKIERKLSSGKGLFVPSKSTTSSSRCGRRNGSRSSRARARSCERRSTQFAESGGKWETGERTQIEKDSALSKGICGMTLNTSGKSKPLQVLMWRPVRLGRCATVARTMSPVSPEQLYERCLVQFPPIRQNTHIECQILQRWAQCICSPCWKSIDQPPGSKFQRDAPKTPNLQKRRLFFFLQKLYVHPEVSNRRQRWQDVDEGVDLRRSAYERV